LDAYLILEQLVDPKRYKMRTLEKREKNVSKHLPLSWWWKDSLPKLTL
jgi:hypothetical protein